jgi:hypothetical protein
MRTTAHPGHISIWPAALSLAALVLAATVPAWAQLGPVEIKGKRYINGVETKVKCSSTEGHTVDATTLGSRTFALVSTVGCPLPDDVGATLAFTGRESQIKNQLNILKARYVFSGGATGGAVGGAEAILKGKPETARSTFRNEKGTLTYSLIDGFNRTIIFVGKYKAKF